ncbi:MAG: SpoIID/LytB domain-containing protein [candidate division WOR-3 bacterium]|jgi:hypothetical protein
MLELLLISFSITFKFKDVYTNFGVDNVQVVVKDPLNKTQTIFSQSPVLKFQREEKGKYEFEFIAQDYKPLKTYFIIDNSTENLNVDVLLEPIEKPSFDNIKVLNNEIQIIGFVSDKESLKPLSMVKVQVENQMVYTDNNGRFFLKLKTFDPIEDENSKTYKVISNRKNFLFSKEGYKNYERKNVLLVPGIYIMKIEMEKGSGYTFENYKHGLIDRTGEEYLIKDGLTSPPNGVYEKEKILKIKEDYSTNETDVIPLPFFDPPSSIRVGTSCSCTNCSSVSVMSLENYVATGLNDEWISSWNVMSLRAGALAYRAYGSWYVLNPINNNYDICSTTCCQVWDSDYSQNTIDAAIYTSGFAISPSANNVARAEYSAENNGLVGNLSCVNNCPCGDGSAGSPCAGWPCISDNVCSGQACFGHGRGMCQWGTKRWGDNGKYWDWMAIHYYSSKGWHISTPMGFLNLSANPTSVQPGQTFTIYTDIYSGAQHSHPQIMLGASLYDGQTWISDPPNDVKITVQPGTNTYSRLFKVPTNIQYKCYDLVVMIWFDINENNLIGSPADLPIDRITKSSYICVTATNLNEIALGKLNIMIKKSTLIVKGNGYLDIYSLDGKRLISENISGSKEYKLRKGIYVLKSEGNIKSIIIP